MQHLGPKDPQLLPTHLSHSPRSCFQPGLPPGIGGRYLLSEAALPVLLQGPPPSLGPMEMPVFPTFQMCLGSGFLLPGNHSLYLWCHKFHAKSIFGCDDF